MHPWHTTRLWWWPLLTVALVIVAGVLPNLIGAS